MAVASVLLFASAAAASPTPGPAAPASSVEQLAESAFREHAAGHFAEAIALYLKAYEVSKAGAVLYNVATIYDRKLHEPELAAEYLRRYLAAPDAEPELVQKATARLTALKADAEAAAKAHRASVVVPIPVKEAAREEPSSRPPPSPPTPKAPAAAGGGLRTTGVVVALVGVAGLGASVGLGALARAKNSDANALCAGSVCSSESGVTYAHQAGTFATAATAAFIGGAVVAAAGVTLYFVAPTKGAPTVAFRVNGGVGQAGLCAFGSF